MTLYATNRFPGDGVTTQYEINFINGYLDKSHVRAYIVDDGTKEILPVQITNENWLNDYTLYRLPATPIGKTLVIFRDTPKNPLVSFSDGSKITQSSMNLAAKQGLFVAVEALDRVPVAESEVAAFLEDASNAVESAESFATAAQNSAVAAEAAKNLALSTMGQLSAPTGSSLIGFRQPFTSATDRTISDKAQDVISVEDFGAVGDGFTDDTAAIQAAINAASINAESKAISLSANKIYRTTNGFSIATDNFTLSGNGATLLYESPAAAYYHCIRAAGNNIAISNINIVTPAGKVRDDTGFGISAGDVGTHTRNYRIHGVSIDGVASSGMWFTNCSSIVVNGCQVNNCLADGIHFSNGCHTITVTGCTLTNNSDDNIAIVHDVSDRPAAARALFSNNVIVGNPTRRGFGVVAIGSSEVIISNNVIQNTTGPGIGSYYWAGAPKTSGLVVSGNTVVNCGVDGEHFGGCGIALLHNNDATIIGNRITNIQDAGLTAAAIFISSATSATITGNNIYDCACDHISASNTGGSVFVSGNNFGYTAKMGARLEGNIQHAIITANSFVGTSGTYDIYANITGFIESANNIAYRGVSLNGAGVNDIRMLHDSVVPSITATTGTLSNAQSSFVYKRNGHFLDTLVEISVVDNGSGSGALIINPGFLVGRGILNGRDAKTGKQLIGYCESGTIIVRDSNGLYPAESGSYLTLSGTITVS